MGVRVSRPAASSSSEGEDTIFTAVAEGDDDTVLALLDSNADINGTDEDGQTALHWAVDRGNLGYVGPKGSVFSAQAQVLVWG